MLKSFMFEVRFKARELAAVDRLRRERSALSWGIGVLLEVENLEGVEVELGDDTLVEGLLL
jgi:hypothetical protein